MDHETIHLGYCPKCGRLSVKAKTLGRFDNWTIECPGCHKMNNVIDLKFKIQSRT